MTQVDIYYADSYGKLYEEMEKGEYCMYEFSSALGSVIHPFLKRPVPWLIGGKQYYDIVTPYGYGGPLITQRREDSQECAQELMGGFGKAFEAYCRSQDIICEFIRFHPLYDNARYCRGPYEVLYNRHTIAIDLTAPDAFSTQFDARCRNMVRKAGKLGVEIEVDDALAGIATFADIYYATMEKDAAEEYYFFSRDYFEGIRNQLAGSSLLINAKHGGQTVASSLFFYAPGGFAHYHLSATRPECYHLAANNLILKAACDTFKARGCTWLHLGGGLSSGENDRLYAFKKSFGRLDLNKREFYIGKKIYDSKAYEQEVKAFKGGGGHDGAFFPEYRA